MGFQQHGHVLFGQTRSDPSLVYDALRCSERQPPTVEEAGFRFEAAAPESAAPESAAAYERPTSTPGSPPRPLLDGSGLATRCA
jgi:hypothetical protein